MRLFVYGGPRLPLGFRLGAAIDVLPLDALKKFFWPQEELSGTFLYVIRDQSGRCKVGVSQDPRRRLRQLQTGHPEPLELCWCAVTPGTGFAIEGVAKRAGDRWRQSGEWFRMNPMALANLVVVASTALGEPLQQVPVSGIEAILEAAIREQSTGKDLLPMPLNSPFLFIAVLSAVIAVALSVVLIFN